MSAVKSLKSAVRHVVGSAAPLFWRALPGPRLVVLTYHRILPADHPDAAIEQPGMRIRPETFAMHLQVLRRHVTFVELDRWLEDNAAGKPLPPLACALTFDDGWKDNYDYAFPALRAAGVPASLFVVTDLVGTQRSFWPNRLARLLHGLAAKRDLQAIRSWPTGLRDILEELMRASGASCIDPDGAIGFCKTRASDEQMNAWLDAIALPEDASARDLLSWDEIGEMQASGLVRIGSHTMRHTRFVPGTDLAMIEAEVTGAQRALAERISLRSEVFCYPNGDHFDAAVKIVAAHHRGAVTTQRGWNRVDADRYRLRRISLHEDISNTPQRLLAAVAAVL